MKKIVLFDPSYGTSNQGDLIINEAVMREMEFLFSNNFLVRYSTHTPLMHFHQLLKKNFISRNCEPEYLKFLGGSNIFKHNLFKYTLDWNINVFTKHLYKNTVSLGGGTEGDPNTINWYTKMIYKSVLSKDFIHSTRDEKTKEFLEGMGFKAVNTGCPTTWNLTPDLCSQIPQVKAKKVIFTLTDYSRDAEQDQKLIDILNASYEEVMFWIQGTEDLEYFSTFKNTAKIKLVMPNLEAYSKALRGGDIDYIGTRLHAGIYAMQHRVRSIIIAIDNRTRDMKDSYGLNTIERSEIDELTRMIDSKFATEVKIDEDKIKSWKRQFDSYGK